MAVVVVVVTLAALVVRGRQRLEGRLLAFEKGKARAFDALARRRVPDIHQLARRARDFEGRFLSGCPDLAAAHDRHPDDAFDS